jgi:hypothetical protein
MLTTNLTGFTKKNKSKSNNVVDIMKSLNLFLKKDLK